MIDLVMGGSPCQGFSIAGKGLNFDDPRSRLFFEFVRLLKECKPKYFLLENVMMKQEWVDVISGILGELYPECITQYEIFRKGRLEPIMINSALVSAQNRKRFYWTNIRGIKQPENKGILLKDILEIDSNPDREQMIPVTKKGNKFILRGEKSTCLDANYYKGLDSRQARTGKVFATTIGCSEKFSSITDGGKAYCITANHPHGWLCDEKPKLFTPVECERLQTVPDNYTDCVSNSQRYKMLGNGWTVDVIVHILKFITHK